MIRFPLVVAGLAFSLSACTNPATVGEYDPNQRLKSGALIGGLVGAGVGAITGDDAAKGAIIGAAAGAIVGGVLDDQANELRRDLDENVGVENTGDRIIVTLPNDILFATDSFAVHPALSDDLTVVADSLKKYPNSIAQVLGHTDNTGSADHNLALSGRRANAVADALMSAGVAFDRIQTVARGEDQPRASNLTEEGKALNRRVEIVILPNG